MAFLDALGKKITQTSQDVVQKTKDTAEVLKFNGMISDEEKAIENFYTQLGRTYHEAHIDSYEDIFEKYFVAIKASQDKIKEYEKEIQQIKGISLCLNCGAELSSTAQFCSSCGTKIEKPEETIIVETVKIVEEQTTEDIPEVAAEVVAEEVSEEVSEENPTEDTPMVEE